MWWIISICVSVLAIIGLIVILVKIHKNRDEQWERELATRSERFFNSMRSQELIQRHINYLREQETEKEKEKFAEKIAQKVYDKIKENQCLNQIEGRLNDN